MQCWFSFKHIFLIYFLFRVKRSWNGRGGGTSPSPISNNGVELIIREFPTIFPIQFSFLFMILFVGFCNFGSSFCSSAVGFKFFVCCFTWSLWLLICSYDAQFNVLQSPCCQCILMSDCSTNTPLIQGPHTFNNRLLIIILHNGEEWSNL